MLQVRAVVLDHYIGKPIDELYENEEESMSTHWQEPVVRVFGSTSNGFKTCVHIHGVYPYIYVPCKATDNPDREALLLGAALDEALRTHTNQKKSRFVFKVTLTSGIPLYGYHSKPRQFFKVFFFNPNSIRKASELLLRGAIMGQRLQPHESHIPFVLQFMIDYNIYGMSFINLSRVKYRQNPEKPDSLLSVGKKDILSDKIKKMTCCYLEVDVLAKDIQNRKEITIAGGNPGLQSIWEDEKTRRRAQDRTSQITIKETQSRTNVKVTDTELMYKSRLAKKLLEIKVQEPKTSDLDSEELILSYPAEVPEEKNILEASVVDHGPADTFVLEGDFPDVTTLIDVNLVRKEHEENEEEREKEEIEEEEDSVLGRNRKEIEAEEAELEEEEGGDMTQALEEEEREAGEEQGNSSSDSDDFWKSMADKIFQLDGPHDSSSESEYDSRRKLNNMESLSPMMTNDSGHGSDSPSHWSSTNIMSILSENSVCPTLSTVCQTPQTFWSNYSGKEWEEPWNWDKTILGSSAGKPDGFAEKDRNAYAILFGEDLPPGDESPVSTMSPRSSAGNALSPPSAILTPASETDAFSDGNVDSVIENLAMERQTVKKHVESVDGANSRGNCEEKMLNAFKKMADFERMSSVSDTRKRTVSLTLKQYIRDCGEIVNVDFKNLNNREMIIIEYKPVNGRTRENKFLIKPLDKFLENWNNAEKRVNNRVEKPKVVNGFGKPEKRTEEISEGGKQEIVKIPGKCYKINENVISQGSIKMKLIKKSRVKRTDGGNKRGEKDLNGYANMNNRNLTKFGKTTCKIRENSDGRNRGQEQEPNDGLIDKINTSFEEYYKNVVRVNTRGRNEETGEDEDEDWVSGNEDESSETEDTLPETRNLDPVKFVSELISTFTRMPSEMPPLSITISLGKGNRDSVPIRLNVQPEQVPNLRKKTRRRMRIENVDGPADSSSEDSLDQEDKYRSSGRKKAKRDAFYRPLNIILQNLSEGGAERRKRKLTGGRSTDGEKVPRNAVLPEPADGVSVSSKSPKPSTNLSQSSRKRLSKEGFSSQNLTEFKSRQGLGDGQVRGSPLAGEPDFIGDSDDERTQTKTPRRRYLRRRKSNRKGIPQVDVDVSTTEDEEISLENEYQEEKVNEDAEKGIVSVYDETSLGVLDKEATGESLMEGCTQLDRAESENNPSGSDIKSDDDEVKDKSVVDGLKISDGTATCLTQIARNDIGTVGSPTEEITLQPGTPLEKVAINSDDSLKSLDTPTQWKVTSPLTLSGAALFGSPVEEKLNVECSKMLFLSQAEPRDEGLNVRGSSESSDAFPFSQVLCPEQKDPSDGSMTLSGKSLQDFYEFGSANDSQNFSSASSNEVLVVQGSKNIVPKHQPPTWEEVIEWMIEKGESLSEGPFYSDPRDVTKAMEVGPKTLRIESTSVVGLKPHQTTLDVMGTEERREKILMTGNVEGRTRSSLTGDRHITIMPLIKPPSWNKVSKWVTAREKPNPEQVERVKRKLMVPLSPGQDSDSDKEMDLSLSASLIGSDGNETQQHPSLELEDRQISSLSESEPEMVLKKGPLDKIKGIKRLALKRKLEPIAEEPFSLAVEEPGGSSSGNTSVSGKDQSADNSYQIRGVAVNNTFGFKSSVENMQKAKICTTFQYMSMLVVEVHVHTRKDLLPDPEFDPIRALFYTIIFDCPEQKQQTGMLVVGDKILSRVGVKTEGVLYVAGEKELLEKLVELVRVWDPDILSGYEIEMHSWGYLVQRGFILEMNLLVLLGRVPEDYFASKAAPDFPEEGAEFDDAPKCVRQMRIPGRIVLDIWRVLRHEISLTSYTFENVMYHLTHERHPLLSYQSLSLYWEHPSDRFRHITVDHYLTRVVGVVKVLHQLDFINRTSELARLFGIQFYEVLSRGSQFRVESIMLRLAKPLNYVAVSPSVAQRASMRAPSSLPLIMEPESVFYVDPVIVLDFQSLYPSMIIAYNYCFSTCLGRVEKLGGREPFEFGCTQLQISPEELKSLEEDITISPVGVAFVKANVRKGILPKMLEEILETRLMVKKSMKENKGDKILQKVLHARQLGLKLIANVTYGYTAANFSGRMPSIEVGDSVVSKGRETLQRAIQLVKTTSKWGARVVYGDTDSIFVLTPGRTREEAFKIGAEIVEAVTQDNPKPVKLKLEKVYQPCILQTKKRYVGYMYESPEQEKPVYEAKGIETVRRDGCPATGKILQKALEILFETKDVSLVKKYAVRQFVKLFQGRINIQDLIFAKEYRGRKGYRPGACVPALQLARQWTQYDKRAEPRVKERVPYVIVNGPPGVPLIRLVRSPRDLLHDPSLRINAVYYITKAIIPAMHRCFSLLGVDVMSWYREMPRKYHKVRKETFQEGATEKRRKTISQYFSTVECVVCSRVTNNPVCEECEKDPQRLSVTLFEKVRRWERCHAELTKLCQSCCGRPTELDCQSIDCPVFFRRHLAARDLDQVPVLRHLIDRYL